VTIPTDQPFPADKQRFYAKVEANADADGCWLWTARVGTDGFGQFWYQGRCVAAHRLAYQWANNDPDRSLIRVTQICGNRLCVNPIHLVAAPKQSESVGYNAVHSRVKALWGSANQYPCITCGQPAATWSYDGTDATERAGYDAHTYVGQRPMRFSLYPEFYAPKCISCHKRADLAALGRPYQGNRGMLRTAVIIERW
jgi:hypothetical protein